MYSLRLYPSHLTFAAVETAAKLNGEGGFPHSEIVGSKLAHSSPTLIAACHVLHRLCMPRHSPNALTSHLRVHTTNDSPDDPKIDHMSLMMRMIVFILSQYSSCVDRHDLDRRRTASLRSIEPARHRLKNPFTMSKCRWAGPKPCQNPSEDGNLCLHIWKIADGFRRQATQNGGAYRDRTDDPLLAKQVLSQLS